MTDKPDRPHDTFFKETFEDETLAAAELQSVLPSTVVRLFDWTTLRVEAGSFQTRKDKNRFCDLLFSVRRADLHSYALVFILFEHQSTNDPLMPLRILRYMVRVWDRWLAPTGGENGAGWSAPAPPLPPILPVVLSHDERGWRASRQFHGLFDADPGTRAIIERFAPSFEYLVDDLSRMSDDDLARRRLPPAATLSLWALRDGRSPDVLRKHLPVWAPVFAALARLPGGLEAITRIIGYIEDAAGDRSPDAEEVGTTLAEHDPFVGKAVMNTFERIREEGREEGRKEGREEARLQGEQRMLLKQLRLKFGELTDEQFARVQRADEADLDRYAQRIFTADSIEAVLGAD
jgi:hypothetical protein